MFIVQKEFVHGIKVDLIKVYSFYFETYFM
jgi:hypothetical protein